MARSDKFEIYYKPMQGKYEYTKSFTLAFSRMNKKDGTYKKKVILEHISKKRNRVEEYKMKEIHTNLNKILEKIEKIDFEKEYTKPTDDTDAYYIMYDGKTIITSEKEEIQEILDAFNFDKLSIITHKHYEYIKDMDEYTKLLDVLNGKVLELDGEHLTILSKIFKDVNPYTIFQSMGWLEKYLDDVKIA